jgi:hypothetical protein
LVLSFILSGTPIKSNEPVRFPNFSPISTPGLCALWSTEDIFAHRCIDAVTCGSNVIEDTDGMTPRGPSVIVCRRLGAVAEVHDVLARSRREPQPAWQTRQRRWRKRGGGCVVGHHVIGLRRIGGAVNRAWPPPRSHDRLSGKSGRRRVGNLCGDGRAPDIDLRCHAGKANGLPSNKRGALEPVGNRSAQAGDNREMEKPAEIEHYSNGSFEGLASRPTRSRSATSAWFAGRLSAVMVFRYIRRVSYLSSSGLRWVCTYA